MLRSTWGVRERGAAPRSTTSRTQCQHLVFGGVAFELLAGDSGKRHTIPPSSVSYCIAGSDPRAIADVVCAVHSDPALEGTLRAPNGVRWSLDQRDRGGMTVRAPSLHAELEPLGFRRYAVTARVAPGHDGMLALLRGISAAVVHCEGGLVFHAAAVELAGRGVLFIGPSGAGKSTAARLTEGGRCFAYDRVAVVPGPNGWLAWGLPGGTAVDAPLADEIVYPLAAILRVKAGSDRPRITPLSGAEALFALRESVESADDSIAAEDVYLRAVTNLASQIAVGSIATVLGRSTNAVLSELLQARAVHGQRHT